MQLALERGYTIIRIVQEDFFNNRLDINETVIKNIKVYDKPLVIFIAINKNIYIPHYEKLKEKLGDNKDDVDVKFA